MRLLRSMASECSAAPPPPSLGADGPRAFELRDYLTAPEATDPQTPSPATSIVDLDDIEYIDGDDDDSPGASTSSGAGSEDARSGHGDTGTVPTEDAKVEPEDAKTEPAQSNAVPEGARDESGDVPSCRLVRWRPVSRRTRGPRAASGSTHEERLHCLALGAGGMSASAGELLSLAPSPLVAVTAPSSPCSPGYLTVPTLAQQSAADYFGSSPECYPESPAPPPGPRYKLATESSLQICCYQYTRTVIYKILSSKLLRRWETHVLVLLDDCIASKTPSGLLEYPLYYEKMLEVYCISRWDAAHKFCLRIVMPDGSLLLQASNAYIRDQWYHSIIWRKNMTKYKKLFAPVIGGRKNKDIVLKELKNMVDYVMTTPLHDESVANTPLQIVTDLLVEEEDTSWTSELVSACAPLLAERGAPAELYAALARLCRRRHRAEPLPAALAPPVRRVLTRNVDFARAPQARRLVCEYISALSSHEDGPALVRRFVEVAHGPSPASCPHPRAAPNLSAVALASLNELYRDQDDEEPLHDGVCFADILLHMSEYPDWLLIVGGVLQPVPLAPEVLRCRPIASRLATVLRTLALDKRCTAHGCLAPPKTARDNPPSWLKIVSPSDPTLWLPQSELCRLWGDMLGGMLGCCYRRKSFLQDLTKQLPDFLVVALTGHPAALEALCLMLEWNIIEGEQTRLEIVATLQGTELGRKHYQDLCEREIHLQQIQSAGGPRRLALPVKTTDADVAQLLAAGSFGNLECLSLAFTSVTSACAYQLIKLPTLRYLNLWATQFGDAGVQLIADHLTKLQVLNLCETPVSDKGIEALAALSNLKRLNLNSTNLSAEAFEGLKRRLPELQEFDIRYTEAW